MSKRQSKGLWTRGDVIYFRFTDAQGKRQRPPTDFRVGQEKEALAALAAVKRQVAAERELLGKADAGEALPTEGVTVQGFGRFWNAKRLKNERTMQAATEDKWKLEYIYRFLGHIRVVEFRTKHGHDFVGWLEDQTGRRGRLGARTIRSVWSCLHNLFRYAVTRELIPVNPCAPAGKGEAGCLPDIEDKDDEWRDLAIFERYEVERLISDELVPEWCRVLWALKFLAGVRDSEAYALTLARYEPQTQPLGRLTVSKGWNTRHQKLKKTKTRKKRRVPVHPTLAKVLAHWLLSGWEAHVGRKPGPDDLLIPNADGGHLRVDGMLVRFREDLAALGLRADRQQYDTRRTFKSLAEDDGASPEKIRWVMWGRRGTVEDGYSAHAWAAFCQELAKLNVALRQGSLIQLKAVGDEIGTTEGTNGKEEAIYPMIPMAGGGTRTRDLLITKASRTDHRPQSSSCNPPEPVRIGGHADHPADPSSLRIVPLCQSGRLTVAAKLEAAKVEWLRAEDTTALRRRLAALLESIGGGG